MIQLVKLPRSVNGQEIQVPSISASVVKITTSGSSVETILPNSILGGALVRVAALEDCYIRFGTTPVVAAVTDTLFPAGVEVMQVPAEATHIAAIQVSTGGVITFTEMI